MNAGEFKQRWADYIGDPFPTLDAAWVNARKAGLISATGRGRSASAISFDDALNFTIWMNAAGRPSDGPEAVDMVRHLELARRTTHRKMPTEKTLHKLGLKDNSFPSAMRWLAEQTPRRRKPWEGPDPIPATPKKDQLSISHLQQHHPLSIKFNRTTYEVEIEMHADEQSELPLPKNMYLRYAFPLEFSYDELGSEIREELARKTGIEMSENSSISLDIREGPHNRRIISECNWFLPALLHLVIQGEEQ